MITPTSVPDDQKEARTAVALALGTIVALLVLLGITYGGPGVVLGLVLVSATVVGLVGLANSGWLKW